jgi:NodT family efflux transporter outer membrane factor (OMF) lipoprotein
MNDRMLIMKMRVAFLTLLLLSGCAVGPDYHRPDVATPAAFKEAGDWKPAEPKDDAPRGNWWEIYGDADLNALVAQVAISNQNVLAAAAQYRQAMALLGVAQAGYYPTLSGSLSGNRAQGTSASANGTSTGAEAPILNTVRLAYSASWEADIWGHIGRAVESSDASAQASNADLQSALLSAQATLVQTYFQLRTNDAQQQLLRQTIDAYRRSLQITRNRYEAGVAGRVDVAQAETQLKSTEAQAIDLGVQRAQFEHAIAVLTGKAPANFQLTPTNGMPALPPVPAALPAALLERRPDIAGAERRMAAANAQIGVAQAAFFPALTLGSTGGYQNSSLSHLLTLPNRFWSIGPALALTLFDAGARSAQKESAMAAYDKSVATYRQTVLAAFQEVEDNLAALRLLAAEATMQQAATQSAAEVLALTENQYQAGTVSYLSVVTAQATALGAQRSNLDIAGRRLFANAVLLKALGGDWPQAPR